MFSLARSKIFLPLLAAGFLHAHAFDNSRSDNLVVYYGQNSYGATQSTRAGQSSLSAYCQDDTINAIPIAFVHDFFSTGGLPALDMSSTCSVSSNGALPGTALPNCQFLADDIQTCQRKGKIITLSLGGATGSTSFNSDSQAVQFADTIWNVFLGGSSSTRPFGTAVLDGIDLDIETGDSTHYAAFVNRLRSHTGKANKKYHLTAAPQCVYPDAHVGTVLDAVPFDAVYVQFYNNWCGLQNYGNNNAWNYDTWDRWAKNSANKNVKIYIGAPASPTAAGSGYVDAATLGRIAKETRSKYSSFGGVMLWDASQAYANGRFDKQIKTAMGTGPYFRRSVDNSTIEARSDRFTKIASRDSS
ncbi:Chitinase 1 [Termitomyces sp. T112]|nr:Chitinase 1 [Termitomyces sp. T112]